MNVWKIITPALKKLFARTRLKDSIAIVYKVGRGMGIIALVFFVFNIFFIFFFFSHFQDVEPPEFVLIPDDIIISSEPGQNYGKAHWLRVLAKDNSERFGFNMSDVRSFEHEIQGLSKDGMEWMGSDEIYFTVFVGWMGLG